MPKGRLEKEIVLNPEDYGIKIPKVVKKTLLTTWRLASI